MKHLRIPLLLSLLLTLSLEASSQSGTFTTPLKSFEGYYTTNLGGQRAYIQITSVKDGLRLKQLWDNHEIDFARKTDLDFEGDAGKFPLAFSKSSDGIVSQVTAFKRDIWTRTNDYKPLTQTYTPTTKDLDAIVGYYQIRSNQEHVEFYVEKGNLLAKQLWDDQVHHMLAQSSLEYISKEAGITVSFVKNDKGEIIKGELSQGDVLDRRKDYKPSGK
jgi:hypothetical protein